MDKKIGPTSGEPKSNLKDNSSSAQRKRLDEALQNRPGGMTTDQIRYVLTAE